MTLYNSLEAYFIGHFEEIVKIGIYIPQKQDDAYYYLDFMYDHVLNKIEKKIEEPKEITEFHNKFYKDNPKYENKYGYCCDFLAYILLADNVKDFVENSEKYYPIIYKLL